MTYSTRFHGICKKELERLNEKKLAVQRELAEIEKRLTAWQSADEYMEMLKEKEEKKREE